jgi:uncharacterized protein YndB with AHSA1/START domain
VSASYEQLIEEGIDVDATPGRVWELIGDPCRMAEWSPQVESVRLRVGHDTIGVGTEFTNLNREDELTWATHAQIVRYASEYEIAFRIAENWVVWSLQITPLPAGGVHLAQQRCTPDGISPYSLELTDNYLGGQQRFTQILRTGMRHTLHQIKDAAEVPVGTPNLA